MPRIHRPTLATCQVNLPILPAGRSIDVEGNGEDAR
jgi:hypothetical protein